MEKSLRDGNFYKLLCGKFFSEQYKTTPAMIFLAILINTSSKHDKMTNHGDEASYELEILEVVRVDVGGRVDLETVVIFTSIFKQAVHGVQHLMGQQEKPLPEREETTEMRKGPYIAKITAQMGFSTAFHSV